jgi:hypothetical protein
MRGRWIVFLIALALLAAIPMAQAAGTTDNIRINIKAVSSSIFADEVATYDVTITNLFDFPDHFRLAFSDDVEWTIQTDPLSYKLSGFDLRPGESATFRVNIQANPAAYLPNRQYRIMMTVRAVAAEKLAEEIIQISYGLTGGRQYPAMVSFQIEMADKIDPRQGIEARILLKNLNPLNITALDINFNSFLVNQHIVEPLSPKGINSGESIIIFKQSLDPLETPKKDNLVVTISYNGEVLDTKSKGFEIISYSQFEESQETMRNSFFKTTHLLTYRNNGNVEKTEKVTFRLPFLQTLFAHSDLKSKLSWTGGKSFLSWDLKLMANETRIIKVTVDYLPLLILVALIIVVFAVYTLTKSPVTMVKGAKLLAQREGGIAGLKIVIKLKNLSKTVIHDLEVVDSVPNIVEIDRNFEMGQIAPTKIVDHGARGILIKWKLGEIEPGEERIVSYRAKSRLTILGNFTLPAAVSRFIISYKEKVSYSNRVRLQL